MLKCTIMGQQLNFYSIFPVIFDIFTNEFHALNVPTIMGQ